MREFNTLSKGIRPNANVIAQLVLEPTYFKAAIEYFNRYSKGTPLPLSKTFRILLEK